MQVDFDRLMRYHEDGKLRHSIHESRSLHVWCYSQATVFNRDWDDLTRLCRGLVTDDHGNVMSRPFPKFFNAGEPEAPNLLLGTPFWAYDKMDGSLIVAGHDADGELVVSTKGSFSTWHSEKAAEMLKGWHPGEGITGIFEFIDPMNRVVVDYQGYSGLVLLGAVDNNTGEDHFQPEVYADETGWAGDIVIQRNINMLNTLNSVRDPNAGPNREGFVIVYPNPEGPSARVKIKFLHYVEMHRILSRLSNVAVWEALRNKTFDALLDVVPDEFYDKVRDCARELRLAHHAVLAEHRPIAAHASTLARRKDMAEFIIGNSPNSALTFAILDGKNWSERIWDHIKPDLDRQWSFLK